MAGRSCKVLDVGEILRWLRLRESAQAVAIGVGVGVGRNAVRDYLRWFEAEKLLPGDPATLPTSAELEHRLTRIVQRWAARRPRAEKRS